MSRRTLYRNDRALLTVATHAECEQIDGGSESISDNASTDLVGKLGSGEFCERCRAATVRPAQFGSASRGTRSLQSGRTAHFSRAVRFLGSKPSLLREMFRGNRSSLRAVRRLDRSCPTDVRGSWCPWGATGWTPPRKMQKVAEIRIRMERVLRRWFAAASLPVVRANPAGDRPLPPRRNCRRAAVVP
jgi:hypothetical protein